MRTSQTVPRRSGRPDAQTAEALNRHILDTAAGLFVEYGYAATSIEQVAARAGASKATIYRRYSSKDELFAAVIKDMVAVILETAEAADTTPAEASDPLARLRAICRLQLDLIAKPEAIAVYRVMVAEAPRFPELVDRVTRIVGAPLDAMYLHLLNAARDMGQIRRDCQVEKMARVLDGLLTGWTVRQNLLGLDGLRDEAEREAFFDTAWSIFLGGVTSADATPV